MSFTLSDFADKIKNAPDDHLVQVKTTQDGTPEIAIVAATSPQTFGRHSVSLIEIASSEDSRASALQQDPDALAQATLLRAIAMYYCLHTDVEADIQQHYKLAHFATPHTNHIVPPDLTAGENIKTLTCREVKQILATAENLAPQSKGLNWAPIELLRQIMSSLGHETLSSAILVDRAWCRVAVPQHAIARAERIHLLPKGQRVGLFVDLFRFFTGEDLDKTIGKKPLEPFLVGPDKTSKAAGLTSLAAQLENLPEYAHLNFFNEILKQSVLLEGDTCREPLVALTESIKLILSPVVRETYDKIHDHAGKLTDSAPLLVALARQIHLSSELRTAYGKIFAQAREMALDKSAPILAALAGQIHALPKSERKEAFDTLFDTALSMKQEHGAPIFAALAGQIHALPDSERKEAFDTLFDTALSMKQEHGAPIFAALASQIEHLPEEIQVSYFDTMFNVIEALAPEHQSAGWAGLASQWFLIDESQTPSYVDRMFIAIEAQSPEHQSASLAGLASHLDQLEPEQALPCFDKVLEKNSLLPGEYQLAAFSKLAQQISNLGMYLEDSTLDEWFNKLLNANLQVHFAYRAAGWRVLRDQAAAFGEEVDGFSDRYDRLLNANALSPGEYQGQTLKDISDLLWIMPMERRRDYFARLFDAMNQLPSIQRADTLTHLQTKVRYLEFDTNEWNGRIAQALKECAAAGPDNVVQ